MDTFRTLNFVTSSDKSSFSPGWTSIMSGEAAMLANVIPRVVVGTAIAIATFWQNYGVAGERPELVALCLRGHNTGW